MNGIINRARYLLIKLLARVGFYYPDRLQYKHLVKFFFYKELFDRAKHLDGAIVECGVAYGQSLIVWSTLAKAERRGRGVYGFDSFEGFPEPSAEDRSPRNAKKGDFKDATQRRLESLISKAAVPMPVLIKGFFSDTLPSFKEKIAVLYIDADLYDSYKTVLDHLYEQVVPGGVIGFDEYGEKNWPGATKAVDEFCKSKGVIMQKGEYVDKYFVVKPT